MAFMAVMVHAGVISERTMAEWEKKMEKKPNQIATIVPMYNKKKPEL